MKTKQLKILISYFLMYNPNTGPPGPRPRVKKIRGRKRTKRKLDRLLGLTSH